ncbi:RNA-directed DNA polymerase, eukaryota, reverse transcriptase zinc-binding domain protein [Tanacetum coccineum]|uniref:RNA-directed DNA polymerase, eukaryota, reverse transcriptase zinc-binding domain protein n=1 Tax=Tanacetum coccineum TaxID=301880 RepID=A0ABQ5DEA0_9ASTR
MIKYFKDQWEIDRLKETEEINEDIEDVIDVTPGMATKVSIEEMEDLKIGMWNIRSMNQQKKQKKVLKFIKEENINGCGIVETHIKPTQLSKVDAIAFGGWDWVSNSVHSNSGCRIMIKSPSKPETSILKKLDRVMVNSEFIDKFGDVHACFHPFLISNHNPMVLHIPNTLEKKRNLSSYRMYKLVQKMKRMKVPLNNLAWKKGNLFLHVKKIEEDLKSVQVEVEANPNCKVVKEKLSKILQEYNEAINDEEKRLAQKAKVKWLSEGDKNTKYFHNVIKSRMHTNRIKGVCDEQGNLYEEESVADQFFKHFEKFLGNNGEIEQIDSPEGLFLNKLSKTEVDLMVRDITDKEIKEAKFVQEFFKSNKLLEESAFVPGRLIQDNLLITQGLLKGYNRKSRLKRCALKIDIAKAYDTVNWGFLKQILTHFGFHKKIIGWIMTCVTSAAFLIAVNGERYGYFKSGRGLRQELKLTQLCFAGDLLMLCNGDHISVKVLKDGLMEFNKISGLIPNMQKSTIFFGSVKENEKQRILEVMPFAVGTLPMKYLGDFKRGAAKVSWKDICTPKSQGGLGIKRLGPWNEALLCKHLWNVIVKKESLWVKWINTVKLKDRSIWEIDIKDSDSGTWKAMLNLRSNIRESVWKKLGDGRSTNSRFDKWCNEVDGEWARPNEWKTMYRCINDIKVLVLEEGEKDCTVWKDENGNNGKFSIRSVWVKFKERKLEIS